MKRIDLTGQRFGRLTVLHRVQRTDRKGVWWLCKCDCGGEKIVETAKLRHGVTRSCGCLADESKRNRAHSATHGKFDDLTGRRFGHLTVLARDTATPTGHIRWKCQCDCGNICYPISNNLKSGRVVSCGCIGRQHRIDANTRHNDCGTQLYHIWDNMKCRCYGEKQGSHKWYKDKGVTICEEWREDFNAFKAWALAHGWEDKKRLSIDRIDSDKGYSPENCQIIPIRDNALKAALLPIETIQQIKNLHENGYTNKAIAQELDVCMSTVAKYIRLDWDTIMGGRVNP